jgi:uncharacterized protein (TIGR00375 family)
MNMKHIADLHIHSKYAGACSEQLTLKNLDAVAKEKGISTLGTGDFTHPEWMRSIKEELEERSSGVYSFKGSGSGTRFILSTEVSLVFNKESGTGSKQLFSKDSGIKKMHNCVLAPSIDAAEGINDVLSKHGDMKADGRPLLSMTSEEFVEAVRCVDKNAFIFPAHAWTPWFGVFGSMSGFDSIAEAYGSQAKHIRAIETGLSSDPSMNWRISGLDDYALISGSDAHSLPKVGREAMVLEMGKDGFSFDQMIDAIIGSTAMTIEFYPEEGKYHFDGHRRCGISLSPKDALKYNNICPKCRRKLTIGVLHRIEELADREDGYVPKGAVPFVHAVPLREVIAYVSGKGVGTEYVNNSYTNLIKRFGSEFNVLLESSAEELTAADKGVGEAIADIRANDINIIPGYDGVFGIIDITRKVAARKGGFGQKRIGDFG